MPRNRRFLLRSLAAVVGTALVAALPVVTPRPMAAVAAGPSSGPGYWLVGGDGSVYPFGSAGDLGSLRGTPLSRPVTGMAPTPSGAGYWMVASDGGIFSFGDAAFYGSTGAMKLNQPIVGMASTPSGKGYWFVAADGGIFSFGDAAFHGSTGAMKLNKPIVGMAATQSGTGYWFVAGDGGIFNFGDAAFLGSPGGKSLPAGMVVMAGINPRGSIPTTAPPGSTVTTGTPHTTATTGPAPTGRPFQIGLIGDSGYKEEQLATFDRVVEHMNTFPLAFVAHDGDFKDPLSRCSDDRFNAAKTAFNKSKAAFVYTPGDNEWMDCDKMPKVENHIDPLDRLAKLRELFFASDESLGINRMPLTTQRQAGFPENARWSKEGVVFATLNAPGPSDNVANTDESNARRQANVSWLSDTFDLAEFTNAPGVMIIWQVDPWQPKFRQTWTYLMEELKERTLAFGKPVVLVHGDTHVFRVDKGGWPDSTGAMKLGWDDVPNFTRVETHAGGPFSGTSTAPLEPHLWIRATVDPTSPQVFSFTTESAG